MGQLVGRSDGCQNLGKSAAEEGKEKKEKKDKEKDDVALGYWPSSQGPVWNGPFFFFFFFNLINFFLFLTYFPLLTFSDF